MSRFLDVEAGGGLVEQQQLRLGGERPGELDDLAHAIGQAGDQRVAVALQVEELDHPFHGLAVRDRRPAGARGEQQVVDEPGGPVRVAADQQVLQHARVLEQLDVLEGARDAERGERCAGTRSRSRRRGIAPVAGVHRRLITLNSVVLPAPFGPISVKTSPSRTSKLAPRTASTPPKLTVTSRTESSASVTRRPLCIVRGGSRSERRPPLASRADAPFGPWLRPARSS
jgi:hypothetical protein